MVHKSNKTSPAAAKLIILGLIIAFCAETAVAIEPIGLSMNRGWPDLGRAISTAPGASQMNPAAISQSKRYMASVGGEYQPPTGDFGMHIAMTDSQSTTLAGEITYSYLRHQPNNPGTFNDENAHRMSFAFSEFYGEVLHFGMRGGFDIAKNDGARGKANWTYGLGFILPLGDFFRIGLESGDWFNHRRSDYQVGRIGSGVALTLHPAVTLVSDFVYRWKEPKGAGRLSGGFGIGVRPIDQIEWRAGYRHNPGQDGSVIATALQGIRFPWTIGGDFRYSSGHSKKNGAFMVGFTVSRAFFYEPEIDGDSEEF